MFSRQNHDEVRLIDLLYSVLRRFGNISDVTAATIYLIYGGTL